MEKIPLIMDCDPGLDDAIALLMALASPDELKILGITTVTGNGSPTQIHENARRICELANRSDVKVFAGCARTFFTKPNLCADVGAAIHGETGLGGCKLPAPTMPLQPQHAVNFIIEAALNAPQPITIAASGPLTNIAAALILEPSISEKIRKIVIMGGSIGLGNITPAAEYNFYSDPQAAYVVFTSGLSIDMLGLDVTRQTVTSEAWLETVQALHTPVSQAVIDMLSHYYRPNAILEPGVTGGGVLHDPNIIAYLLKPELYKGSHVYVEIDISQTISAGRSTVDWYKKVGYPELGYHPNTHVLSEVNVEGFFALLMEKLQWYKA
jgi:purine nucleosidase